MSCPNPSCSKELSDAMVETLLTREQYEKYHGIFWA